MSWIITIPVGLVGGYWAYKSIDRFYTYALRYDPSPDNLNITPITKYEFQALWHRAKKTVAAYIHKGSELKTIHLMVPNTNLSRLEAHMPQSGYKYVKGGIFIDGKWEKAKYRYRGDYLYHWAWDKKSIRIKTSKGKLFEGLRTFNLQAPKFAEQLNNYFGYALAREMGLIVPRSELVRVFLNGEDRGVHVLIEQINETTIRRSGLMPGDIYRGEIVGKDSFADNNPSSLFQTSSVWDKVAVNNHYDTESKVPLEHFIDLLKKNNSAEDQSGLSKLLDMEAWGRFSAFEALQVSRHFAKNHNQRLYYDPWRQKIIPVIWDPVGWPHGTWRPKPDEKTPYDVIDHSFQKALYVNGDFLRERNKALNSFFALKKDEKFIAFVSKTISLMEREIQTDYFLRPPDAKSVSDAMREMEVSMVKGFKDIKREMRSTNSSVIYSYKNKEIGLSVLGRNPIQGVRMIFNAPLTQPSLALITYKTKFGERREDISDEVKIDGNTVIINIGLLSNLSITSDGPNKRYPLQISSFPGIYKISFPEMKPSLELISLQVNRGTGWVDAKLSAIPKLRAFTDIHYPISRPSQNNPLIWSGDVKVSGVMEIERPLIIKPGTKVLMGAGASLIMRNKVFAEGTIEEPILFLPQKLDQKPWGTIALLGKKAAGSRFNHCDISQGSGLKGSLFEYSGMLSIHDVKGVKVSDCVFRDNSIVDDMVHAVYSEVTFTRTTFINSFSDALDLDMSEAIILDSRFENSGNDAIDLMTTRAQVTGTSIHESRDKGISVGEASQLLIFDSNLIRNNIAVQAKDKSTAILFHVNMIENKIALSAFSKNWQYGGGGEILVSKSNLTDNGKLSVINKGSFLQLFDSFADVTISKTKRISAISVDNNSKKVSYPDKYLPGESEMKPWISQTLSLFDIKTLALTTSRLRGAISNANQ